MPPGQILASVGEAFRRSRYSRLHDVRTSEPQFMVNWRVQLLRPDALLPRGFGRRRPALKTYEVLVLAPWTAWNRRGELEL